jgi:hypothetical protein
MSWRVAGRRILGPEFRVERIDRESEKIETDLNWSRGLHEVA